MNIRYARPNEAEQIRSLWIEGFGAPQPYTDWYFHQVYRPERTICLWEEGKLASCLQLAPYRLMLNGQIRRAAYLVGVVTGGAYRHRGFGHSLLRYTFGELKQSGYSMAMLYTDIPEFYAPLGFVHCYQLRHQCFPAQELPLPPAWRCSQRNGEDLARCDQIYRSMTRNWNGYLLRSPENWRNFTDDFLCDGGELWLSDKAYLLWFPEDGRFRIHEIGYITMEALEEAITLAKGLARRQGFSEAHWYAPLPAPQFGETKALRPHVMCRRLDMPDSWPGERIAQVTLESYRMTENSNWVNEIT